MDLKSDLPLSGSPIQSTLTFASNVLNSIKLASKIVDTSLVCVVKFSDESKMNLLVGL